MDCWDWLMVDRRNYQRALARSYDRFGQADLGRPEREDWNLDDNNKTHAPRHCGALRQGAAGRHSAGQWCLDTGGRARVCAAAVFLHLVHTSSTPDRYLIKKLLICCVAAAADAGICRRGGAHAMQQQTRLE